MYDSDDDEDQAHPVGGLLFNIIGQQDDMYDFDYHYNMANLHDFLDDYDSDDGDFFDDDMYDDDLFDDDPEDEEEKFKKIFVTLQDSHVINRLSFHKKLEGMFRYR